MHYMLDTNICIYIMKRQPPEVESRLRDVAVGDVSLSGIVLAELWYGIHRSQKPERNEAALRDFLRFVNILDWPLEAAGVYGAIRAALTCKGSPIGGNDLLIAAHAIYEGATLVTNNGREFERVPRLNLENWAAR
ncbi:type II toxin-antitoxin system tRNA(fMet)-specific endonuclease VapC [Acidithiobacillus ferriphilus]|uniref:type II toxin-antitoxin system tRNA(fMet)-specific endonuclease VapC n=1 Tax=Acidithiobacillus ferriphilus TaxID=1689834 RepID=UPI002DBBBDB5|nr:type II toxin-antitoxin system VapC family toxin [Acidithiobacillus ferriphilus]MEB8475855.1 type II toxin-antitoxin system VapC family toxin [Acidithiobacillus ferriphilus]